MNNTIIAAIIEDIVVSVSHTPLSYLKDYCKGAEETIQKDLVTLVHVLSGKRGVVSEGLEKALMNVLEEQGSAVQREYHHIKEQISSAKARRELSLVLQRLCPHYVEIIVESAGAMEKSDQEYILGELRRQYPISFPTFKKTPRLLGGMRLFVGGEVIDASWRKQVSELFTSLSVSS